MRFALPDGGTARIDDAENAVKSVCAHPLVDAEIAEFVRLELERDQLRTDMNAKKTFAPFASADYHLHQIILRSWNVGLGRLVALVGPIGEAFGADCEDIEGLVIEELGERIRHRLSEAYRAVPACLEGVFARPPL
jgi:hypothetical protein